MSLLIQAGSYCSLFLLKYAHVNTSQTNEFSLSLGRRLWVHRIPSFG